MYIVKNVLSRCFLIWIKRIIFGFYSIKKQKMNIHEYQGKSILKSFGVSLQEGIVASTPEKADNVDS